MEAVPVERHPVETRGRELLAAHLESTTQTALAKRLGVAQPRISDWVSGACRPRDQPREMLLAVAGIPVDAWRTAEERSEIERIRSASTEPAGHERALPTAVGQ